MWYIILLLILMVASFFIGQLGCMDVYRPLGFAIFTICIILILNKLDIFPFNFINQFVDWLST
ncbi:hypothetical protein [Alkaliphilus sp. B6464]|uniref:hypothetical protein n=1 Tax=Alkaliphilus sp. B6464 TaxID=2731219 RepID=UPI001BAC318F|nr:hypothetical protein [Alkaliphilus sp. B6464]QUH22204.1 hypothetical protein HYG84_20060 [Alkaliphilus sp. B6464]